MEENRICLDNIQSLIIKTGRKLFGAKDYNGAIVELTVNGIIENILLWIKHEHTIEHIKAAIIVY